MEDELKGDIMTKNDLVDKIANDCTIPKKTAEQALSSFLDGITEGLQSGEIIRFIGFGSFEISERKARSGRNPQTGETINIPSSKQVKFKAGKKLKEAVQE